MPQLHFMPKVLDRNLTKDWPLRSLRLLRNHVGPIENAFLHFKEVLMIKMQLNSLRGHGGLGNEMRIKDALKLISVTLVLPGWVN